MGETNLTNSELLAIIIKNGTKKYNCLEIARNILNSNNEFSNMSDLEFLSNLSIEELKSYDGIGKVKAIQIRAVIELSKRIATTYVLDKKKITSPHDIFKLVHKCFIGKKQEILKTVILNKSNNIISIMTNAIGNTDNINIGAREIF